MYKLSEDEKIIHLWREMDNVLPPKKYTINNNNNNNIQGYLVEVIKFKFTK